VIKETLRRHPPATRFLRTVTKDQEIGGYKIPADVATLVQCFGYCLISSDFVILSFSILYHVAALRVNRGDYARENARETTRACMR